MVSVLYGIYEPNNKNIGLILDNFFSSSVNTYNYLNPIVQKGAKNTINIGDGAFLQGAEISLPVDSEEQEKIADFFSGLDKKIRQTERALNLVKTFKKGLLQQMFV